MDPSFFTLRRKVIICISNIQRKHLLRQIWFESMSSCLSACSLFHSLACFSSSWLVRPQFPVISKSGNYGFQYPYEPGYQNGHGGREEAGYGDIAHSNKSSGITFESGKGQGQMNLGFGSDLNLKIQRVYASEQII